MKITALIENMQDTQKHLKFEHGLSMFLETKDCNILFDTGKSGDFINNAKKLNIDLKSIDILVLSHAHYDHCGGVKRLLENYNIKPKFIVSEHFFENSNKYHYSNGTLKSDFSDGCGYKYIGIDFDEDYIKSKGIDIHYVKTNMFKISDEVFVFSNFNKTYDFEKVNKNMKIKIGNEYIVDEFKDEIALGVKTSKGLVVLLGCSHPGFLNIISTIRKLTGEKIYAVIGGTHLIEADESRIEKSIKCLNKLNIDMLGLSHCTGENAINAISNNCNGFFYNRTGTKKEIL
jgi:7,8-dihydropterin-6-yl-methyl-4-(beta-D-ribofuranosyl)aminobenzene 5'-phosphate synthase